MFSIDFNNYNSYRDLGLVVQHKPNISTPSKNINNIYIEGRSGSLTEDLKTYRDIEINITFGFKNNEMSNKCRLLKEWFTTIQNNKLEFSDDPGMFYFVKYTKTYDIERIKSLGKFNVTFVCKPFQFYEEGIELIEIIKPTIIYSPEFVIESEPTIKVYGSGDIILNINDKDIALHKVEDYIVIDSTIQDCYKDEINCNNKMVGDFPIFINENKINWRGNINKMQIIPNWRCL